MHEVVAHLFWHLISLSYTNTLILCTTDLTQIICLGCLSHGIYTAWTHTRTQTYCSCSMFVEFWRSVESLWRRTIPSTIIYRSSAGRLSIIYSRIKVSVIASLQCIKECNFFEKIKSKTNSESPIFRRKCFTPLFWLKGWWAVVPPLNRHNSALGHRAFLQNRGEPIHCCHFMFMIYEHTQYRAVHIMQKSSKS